MTRLKGALIGFASALCLNGVSTPVQASEWASLPDDLTRLSLEELLDIQVTSVSLTEERWSEAAAAVQVITAQDIRNSGAQDLPGVLRLATGLHVAQINGRSWAITARGLNSSLADKMEVRLDGRSLYTPLFSGVLWEAQMPALETIDRIEIIRGPGASLWGANAVNGVINIVSKAAYATRGALVSVAAGNELEHSAYLRYGLSLGKGSSLRLNLQTQSWDSTRDPNQTSGNDAREQQAAGLRWDWESTGPDSVFVSLNRRELETGSAVILPGAREAIDGTDLTARWTRTLARGGDIQVQASYEDSSRLMPGWYAEQRQQWELDFRHHRPLDDAHEVVWGVSWRRSVDELDNQSSSFNFTPSERALDTRGLFGQWRWRTPVGPILTLGTKLEYTDYTDLEVQPTLRLAWKAGENQYWASLSRATRVPNRVDRDYFLTPPQGQGLVLVGNQDFESERALVGEWGWRRQFAPRVNLDLTLFYADYTGLRGVSPVGGGAFKVANAGSGRTFGSEMSLVWSPLADVRVWFSHTYLDVKFAADPSSGDFTIAGANEQDPRHQILARAEWAPNARWQLNTAWRHVGKLDDLNTPAYTEADLRLAYRPSAPWELSLVGRNLLNTAHPEFSDESGAQAEREVYLGVTWELP